MRDSFCKAGTVASLLLTGALLATAQTTPPETSTAPATTKAATKPAKQVLLPARIDTVPAGNDFNNPDSTYSYKHSKSSDNFVLFWDKEYGDNPAANTGNSRFNPDELISEADRFYNYYVDVLKWVDKDKSVATKYKFLFFVISNSRGGTAYGGSAGTNIGAFWSPASRVARGPYGVVAHELGHSFQALDRADGAASFSGGSIAEMTSQFMLWQVYPEWQTFENYHLTAFMRQTHLAFLNSTIQYDTCYPLEYFSFKHGVETIGRLWREVQRGEDICMTYKRIYKVNQDQFNDEMFDGCRRFVTWDFPRVDKTSARYADQHISQITRLPDEGWFQIGTPVIPQNYGYNAIKLKVPAAGTKVTMDFKGIAGTENFSQVQLDKAGWRYGFLSHKDDGTRVYSDVFKKADGTADFTVPAGTKFLWLVVMGAPTEHWIRGGGGGGGAGGRAGRGGAATDEQWPYKFKLTGTSPDDSVLNAPPARGGRGARGGGG